jgi:chromate transporter
VLQALLGLGRAALRTKPLVGLAALCVGAGLLGLHEIAILLGAGLLVAAARRIRAGNPPAAGALVVPFAGALATAGVSAAPFGLTPLFLFFLKVGSILFGSGYVLLAFLRADLVERYRWMTEAQLLDAVAVGQITPGPVFTTATFIGYVLGGVSGAATATAGIFLPAFFFVALSGPLLPRMRKSPDAGAFLDGINIASLSLMALVTWQLGRAAVVDRFTALLAAASALLLIRLRVNSFWLILGGAIAGILAAKLR